MRHAAVLIDKHLLHIFYTRVGDAPEHILKPEVDMRGDWLTWQATVPVEVLSPGEAYEGIQYPFGPSPHGAAVGINQLCDPFVMVEEDIWAILYRGGKSLDLWGMVG